MDQNDYRTALHEQSPGRKRKAIYMIYEILSFKMNGYESYTTMESLAV